MADFEVVDADGHVMEATEPIAAFLPPEMRALAPAYWADEQGRFRQLVGGVLKPAVPAPPEGWQLPAGAFDPTARVTDMDRAGIGRSVLFPTLGLGFASLDSLAVQIALCRAYNDWLAEQCAAHSGRLIGVAVVPQADLRASLDEATRAVESLGFRAVMMRPNPIAGRTLDHPYWEPLWSRLEDLDVPLAVHEGTTGDVPQSGRDRFENYLMRHVCSHPHEQQMACLGLIVGGALERHRKLRAVFLESGCGWLPHWLERIDEHLDSWGHCVAPLPRTATEVFQQQCFISCEPGEKGISAFVDQLGDDCLVFASDYPHPDAVHDDVVGHIENRPELSQETKRKILRDNAMRCFRLD